MDILVIAARECINRISGIGEQDEYTSISHLKWMVDKAVENVNWPSDKKVRWLGFVLGTTDRIMYGANSESVYRMVCIQTPILSRVNSNYRHEQIIINACDDVLCNLESASMETPDYIHDLIFEAGRCATANKTSFCLGFCQSYMTAMGLIDVNQERDRTRPIFHAAYEACGYEKPITISK